MEKRRTSRNEGKDCKLPQKQEMHGRNNRTTPHIIQALRDTPSVQPRRKFSSAASQNKARNVEGHGGNTHHLLCSSGCRQSSAKTTLVL
mmetsp:Transcript_8177/g.21798  ORF Transcript_8177/g.21798 Transcript_8177/m.21798 type:complete len:89 (-) Transcript_8177:455-721(-)